MVRTLGILLLFSGSAIAAGAASMRLYVTNSLGDNVSVIDLATLKPVRTFKVGEHVHGITNVVPGTGYEAVMRAPGWRRGSGAGENQGPDLATSVRSGSPCILQLALKLYY